MSFFLGIDLGTSAVKAVLLDDDQNLIAEASAPLSLSRSARGWSEQDPKDWVKATEKALLSLGAHFLSEVAAIGLSGQMHGAVLLDDQGEVLRPCMLWNDTRAHLEAQEMDADPDWQSISGNIVFPGFTAPKLEWVRRAEPEIFEKIAKVLLPKDYLRFWLTGDYVSEMSDAAGTSWLDTERRDWSDLLLAKSQLTRDQMPRLIEGASASGNVQETVARGLGLPKEVIVAGGAGDNSAAAIGVGVVNRGDAFVSLGTSGVLFAVSDGYAPQAETAVHSFCHAIPKTWHQMGVTLSCADSLNWYAGFTGETAAKLTGQLGALKAPGKTVFLPFLGGERTPLNDAQIRGAFFGLEHATDQEAGTRAVLEGATYALKSCQEALLSTGTELRSCVAVGGGSNSDYWLSLIATVLRVTIERPDEGDFGAAFGAARLGMLAGGAALSSMVKPKIARVFEPIKDLEADFEAGYLRYKDARKFAGEWT